MAEESIEKKKEEKEEKEEKKPQKPPAQKKEKMSREDLAARIALYIAFIVLFLGILVKLEYIDILGIKPSNYMLMTMIWLLTSIAIVLWGISKKLPLGR